MDISLGDFSKLNITLQSILAGTILLMPFFFIDVFLYHRILFVLNPIYLTIILSYVLSMSWITVFIIILFLINLSFSKDGKVSMDDVMPEAVSFAIFGIIMCNIIIYIDSTYFDSSKATFKDFILILSSIAIGLIIFSIINVIVSERKRKKKNNIQLEIDFNKVD